MGKRAQNYRAWRYQNPNGTPEQAWNAAWDSHSANQYSRTMQRLGDELNAMTGIANTQKDIIGEQQAEIERLKELVESAYHEGWVDGFNYSDTPLNSVTSNADWVRSDARVALAATEPKG